MTSIERTAYPRFKTRPSATELVEVYFPTPEEVKLASTSTRGEGQLLDFVLMLKSFQRLGYFPMPDEVPGAVVSHLRLRLGLSTETEPTLPERSRYRYHAIIREYLGVEAYGEAARRVAAETMREAAFSMDDPADLVNAAIEELVRERYELPGFSTLDRLARHTRRAVNERLFSRVDEILTAEGKRKLDGLLESGPQGRSELNQLKAAPKSPTKKNLTELQERLVWLESLGETASLLAGIPETKVAHLASQARALDAAELAEVGRQKRRAMLVCLIHRAKVTARDGLAEMLVKTMGKVQGNAKEALEDLLRERRATTEHLVGVLEKILAGVHEYEDNAALGRKVREVLAEGGGAEALMEASISLSTHRGGNYLPLMWKFYKAQRATLFRVIRSLIVQPTTEDRSLIEALDFVLENDLHNRRGELVPGELDLSFASERWRELVEAELDGKPMLARRHLEVCVFSAVAGELKTGDLCVEGSETYADYREQLLSWEECEPVVDQYCEELGLSPTPEGFVQQLKELLSGTAEEVDRSYPENASVVIAEDREPVLKKAVARKPTRQAKILEVAIAERIPERNLTDVVCAGEHHTNWSRGVWDHSPAQSPSYRTQESVTSSPPSATAPTWDPFRPHAIPAGW